VTTHAAACTTRSTGSNRSIGWVHFALVALVVVLPAIARSLRLVEPGGPHLLPANPRLTASPVPAVAEYVIGRSACRRATISRPTINSRSIRATAKVGS
jgi:hypothetical protein